jgi:Flp pilus assembly protein TadB
VSKQRQVARAHRERLSAQQAAAKAEERERVDRARARREQRALAWRRMRLWQHGSGFRRHRERWGALAILVLLVLLLVWLFSRSVGDVLVTALALVVCLPVLVLLIVDRKKK